MADLPFNINDQVRVKLTPVGLQFLKANGHDWRLTPDASNAPDERGWSTWQLWDLMQIFGPIIYHGCSLPFETSIIIKGKHD